MYSFFRALGQALGVAIGGAVFQNQIHRKLLAYPLLAPHAAEYSKDAAGLVAVIQRLPEGEGRRELIQGYADSLKVIWVTMCGLAGVALVASLWTEGLDLNRPLETEQYFLRGGSVSTTAAGDGSGEEETVVREKGKSKEVVEP